MAKPTITKREITEERRLFVLDTMKSMIKLAKNDFDMYMNARKALKWYWECIIDFKILSIRWLDEWIYTYFENLILEPLRIIRKQNADKFYKRELEENLEIARKEFRIQDNSANYNILDKFNTENGNCIIIGIPYSDTEKRKQRFAYTMEIKENYTPELYRYVSTLDIFKYE